MAWGGTFAGRLEVEMRVWGVPVLIERSEVVREGIVSEEAGG